MRLFYSTPSQRAASEASQGTGGAISECPRTARVRSSEIPFLSCTRHAEFKFRILTAVAGALDWPRLSCTKTKSQGDKFQSQAANKGRREDQGATGGAGGGRRPEVPTEVADGAACADGGRRRSGARRRKSPTGEGVLSPRALTWIHPSTGRFQLVRPIPNREEPGCWSYRYALGGCTGIREPGTPI